MAVECKLPDVGQGRQLLPPQLAFDFILSAGLFKKYAPLSGAPWGMCDKHVIV